MHPSQLHVHVLIFSLVPMFLVGATVSGTHTPSGVPGMPGRVCATEGIPQGGREEPQDPPPPLQAHQGQAQGARDHCQEDGGGRTGKRGLGRGAREGSGLREGSGEGAGGTSASFFVGV